MMNATDSGEKQKLINERFIDENGDWHPRGFQGMVLRTKWYTRYLKRKEEDYNRVFQEACKKWPDVTEELICDIDGWSMIHPCKWGDIDGKKIHDKHWK